MYVPRWFLRTSKLGARGFRRSPILRRGVLTSSYSKGPAEPPLLQQTIPEHFNTIVSKHGDNTAIVSRAQRKRLTYGELDAQSNQLARGLRELGVQKGDRVAVSLGNNVEYAVSTYALFKLGAILVPLNPAFNSPQVISALSHLDASHLIIGHETNVAYKPPRENVSLLKQISPDIDISTSLNSSSVPSLRSIISVDNSSGRVPPLQGTTPFQDLITTQPTTPISDVSLHPTETINIQFTSGTTSAPKAACLTHHNILNNGFSIGARMLLTPSDKIVCPPPLFHCFGSVLGYMASATHGSSIIFPSEAFDPLATLLAIQEEKATALYGVATMFVAELELLANGVVKEEGFENLRTGIAAGSSVPSELMRKLHETLNLGGLTICYGMTETSPVSCMTTPDDPLQKRVDSVGRLLPHVEARIVDVTDRSKILPVGEKGELVVGGYLVMKEYWGDKSRTEEVRVIEKDEDGKEKVWMHTGDEAEMDEDGYVRITGRIKDLIIRGGENIHPLEVENCLFQHDGVREASVVGVPDERYGECVVAFVVLRGGWSGVDDDEGGMAGLGGEKEGEKKKKVVSKEELKTWVREKLSPHLVPKHIFWCTEYPKTASGKIQKFKLQEEARGLLGI